MHFPSGVARKKAASIGIAVDHRRRNRCAESLQTNAQRLKVYKSKLIVFPRKAGKVKAGDSEAAECANAQQVKGAILPMPAAFTKEKAVKITPEMIEESVFHKLRMARADYRLFGVRQKNRLAKAQKD